MNEKLRVLTSEDLLNIGLALESDNWPENIEIPDKAWQNVFKNGVIPPDLDNRWNTAFHTEDRESKEEFSKAPVLLSSDNGRRLLVINYNNNRKGKSNLRIFANDRPPVKATVGDFLANQLRNISINNSSGNVLYKGSPVRNLNDFKGTLKKLGLNIRVIKTYGSLIEGADGFNSKRKSLGHLHINPETTELSIDKKGRIKKVYLSHADAVLLSEIISLMTNSEDGILDEDQVLQKLNIPLARFNKLRTNITTKMKEIGVKTPIIRRVSIGNEQKIYILNEKTKNEFASSIDSFLNNNFGKNLKIGISRKYQALIVTNKRDRFNYIINPPLTVFQDIVKILEANGELTSTAIEDLAPYLENIGLSLSKLGIESTGWKSKGGKRDSSEVKYFWTAPSDLARRIGLGGPYEYDPVTGIFYRIGENGENKAYFTDLDKGIFNELIKAEVNRRCLQHNDNKVRVFVKGDENPMSSKKLNEFLRIVYDEDTGSDRLENISNLLEVDDWQINPYNLQMSYRKKNHADTLTYFGIDADFQVQAAIYAIAERKLAGRDIGKEELKHMIWIRTGQAFKTIDIERIEGWLLKNKFPYLD